MFQILFQLLQGGIAETGDLILRCEFQKGYAGAYQQSGGHAGRLAGADRIGIWAVEEEY